MQLEELKQYIEQRRSAVSAERDAYLAEANQRLSAYAGQLLELDNLLTALAARTPAAGPVGDPKLAAD